MQMITTRTIGAAFVALFIAAGGPAYGQDEDTFSDPMEDQAQDEGTFSGPTEDHGAVGCRSVDGTGRQYTVQEGDTLGSIAARFCGDASEYRKIFQANRSIIDDPNNIEPGLELTIPTLN